MYSMNKSPVLYLIILLTLVASLVFPITVFADDGAPTPPPDSPTVETSVPSVATDAVSTEAAPTDAPANPTDAVSAAPATEVPADPTEVAPTNAAATDSPVDPTATADVSTPAPVEPTADVVAALNDAGAVLLDESGNAVPLGTQQAADVLSVGDPIGCPAGVAPVSFGGSGAGCTASYTSIQAAINDGLVASGWTIYIDAGSYYENVTINKSVTLQGRGQTQTFVYPNLNNPDTGCAGSCANTTNTVFLVTADNVFIRDLTINGDSPLLSGGPVVNGADINTHNGIVDNNNNGLTVENVTIKNVYARGIQYGRSGGTFTIRNNTIDNVAGDYYSIGIFNTGASGTIIGNTVNNANDAISANHSQGTQFLNNIVTNSGSGIHTDNYGDSGLVGTDLIDGNTISNGTTNSYGIFVFAPYSPITVSNNHLTNVDYGLTLSGNGWSDPLNTITFNDNTVNSNIAGAYVTTDVWWYFTSDVKAVFNNNIFTGGQYGLYLESQGAGDPLPGYYSNGCDGDCVLNVTGSNNSITDHTLADVFLANGQIAYYNELPGYNGIYNVNVPGNWWGTTDPDLLASRIAAGVNYTPWLTQNPFAASVTLPPSGEEASRGNGQGQIGATLLVPVTGGQETVISCDSNSMTIRIEEINVTLTGLCGYDVVLEKVSKDNLPGDLGQGNNLEDGVLIKILKDGKVVDTLPLDASLSVAYPKPSSSNTSVLTWNGKEWQEQVSYIDGNNIVATLTVPSTLVLVTH